MPEGPKTIITSLHTYNVNTSWDNCSINLSPQTLLDISAYTQANRAKLEQEAQENIEIRAQLADTVEMHPVNPEWRYRTSDLRLSPLPTGGKSTNDGTDEGVESSLRVQPRDRQDTHPTNPEWRYQTSDLRLSPLPTGGKSADDSTDEGADYNLRALLRDGRDTHPVNQEWRYRTSDLR